MTPRFAVLLPVKSPGRGKSRLAFNDRAALTRAFVLDTIAALKASTYVDQVYVVCDDPAVDFGVPVLADRGAGDLNAALVGALAQIPATAAAVVLPDLPALRTADVDTAFSAIDGEGRWFVSDHLGLGTTFLATVGGALRPAFGRDSAARHRQGGAGEIGGELASLRLDVDTLADLEAARQLGVGKNTAAVLPRKEAPPQRRR